MLDEKRVNQTRHISTKPSLSLSARTGDLRSHGENKSLQCQFVEAHKGLPLWDLPACRSARLLRGRESRPRSCSAPGSTGGRDTCLLPRRGSYDDRRSPRRCPYAHCCRGLHWRTPRRIAWHVLGKLSGGRVANRALDLEWDYDGPKEPQEQGADPNHFETGHQTRGASRTPRKTENRADLSQRGWQCDRSRQPAARGYSAALAFCEFCSKPESDQRRQSNA